MVELGLKPRQSGSGPVLLAPVDWLCALWQVAVFSLHAMYFPHLQPITLYKMEVTILALQDCGRVEKQTESRAQPSRHSGGSWTGVLGGPCHAIPLSSARGPCFDP